MYEDKALKEAVIKSIRKYFEGEGYENYKKSSKKFKYSKKYFDRFEENHFGSVKDHNEDLY